MRQSPGLNQNRIGVGQNTNNINAAPPNNSFAQRINQNPLPNAGNPLGPPGMQNTPFDFLSQNIKQGVPRASNPITNTDDFPTLNQVNQARNIEKVNKIDRTLFLCESTIFCVIVRFWILVELFSCQVAASASPVTRT